MSKQLGFGVSVGCEPSIIGTRAGALSNAEIVARSSCHVYGNTPRHDVHDPSIPAAVPVAPMIHSKPLGHVAADFKQPIKPASVKAISTPDQMNGDAFGTDFRHKCLTCKRPAIECRGHFGHHKFPMAVCSTTNIKAVCMIARRICYACSRLTSPDLESALAEMAQKSGDRGQEMDAATARFDTLSSFVNVNGQFIGGAQVAEHAQNVAARWAYFIDKKTVTNATRYANLVASNNGMRCATCPHCGMIQPVTISETKDGRVYATWSLEQQRDGAKHVWKPDALFWTFFAQCLVESAASTLVDMRSLAVQVLDASGDEDDTDPEYWTKLAPRLRDEVARALNANNRGPVDWVASSLYRILMKPPHAHSRAEQWIVTVMPFVSDDALVVQGRLARHFTMDTIRRMIGNMRPGDVTLIGKSNNPMDHPVNMIQGDYNISSKQLRPSVQKTSGQSLSANDTVTENGAKIIRYSGKLGQALNGYSEAVVQSWAKTAKLEAHMDAFKKYLVKLYGHVPIQFMDFHDDIRGSHVAIDATSVYGTHANLTYEFSSIIDTRLASAALPRGHNSAKTGAAGAKNLVKSSTAKSTGRKVAVIYTGDDESGAAPAVPADDADLLEPKTRKRARATAGSLPGDTLKNARKRTGGAIVAVSTPTDNVLPAVDEPVHAQHVFQFLDVHSVPLVPRMVARCSYCPTCLQSRTPHLVGDRANARFKMDNAASWQGNARECCAEYFAGIDPAIVGVLTRDGSRLDICTQEAMDVWANVVSHVASRWTLVKLESIAFANDDLVYELDTTQLHDALSRWSITTATANVDARNDMDAAAPQVRNAVPTAPYDNCIRPLVAKFPFTATCIPDPPDQPETLRHLASSVNANSMAKRTTDSWFAGKYGSFKRNGFQKRANFTCRLILKPSYSYALNCVGLPVRVCLSQIKPVKVTSHNKMELERRVALSRYWTVKQFYPDLGGAESIVTHEGAIVNVYSWATPVDYLFNDDIFTNREADKRACIANEKDAIQLGHIALEIGWTVNCYLEEGDPVVVSRPPILQRANHNQYKIIPVPGYALVMNPCGMKGLNADCDGDAVFVCFPQSFAVLVSITCMMAMENNIICPRAGFALAALSLDCLIGACLMIKENTGLNATNASQLLSCYLDLTPRRLHLVYSCASIAIAKDTPYACGVQGDPRQCLGMLWNYCDTHTMVRAAHAFNSLVCGRSVESVPFDERNASTVWTRPDPNPATGLYHTRELFEMLFPLDFCYVRTLKQSRATKAGIAEYLTKIDEAFAPHLATLSRFQNIDHIRRQFPAVAPDNVVVIRYGRWICGNPSSETLGSAPNSIVQGLWRMYGKYVACDWLSNAARIGQRFVCEMRGFTCSFADIVLGGKDAFLDTLITGDADLAHLVEPAHDEPVPYYKTFVPKYDVEKYQLARVEHLLRLEHKRAYYFSQVRVPFDKVNAQVRAMGSVLSAAQVAKIYAGLDAACSKMVLFGANMMARHGASNDDNAATFMSKIGAKGNPINAAQMSIVGGVARRRHGLAFGANIEADLRNFPVHLVGERSPASMGFVSNGYAQGMTGEQFIQASTEDRIRMLDSADPAAPGHFTAKLAAQMNGVSMHDDGTVRDQVSNAIMYVYGGDGYDAVHVDRFILKGSEILSALETKHAGTHAQLSNLVALALGPQTRTPENHFASTSELLQRGIQVHSNVDLMSCVLSHSQRWHMHGPVEQTDEHLDACVSAFRTMFRAFMRHDRHDMLSPFGVLLFIRVHMDPAVFAPSRYARASDWTSLFENVFTVYVKKMVDTGEPVGPLAEQSLGSPSTQLVMHSFKTDVVGTTSQQKDSHITSGFARLEEIFNGTDSANALTTVALDPSYVTNEVEARFVASRLRGCMMRSLVDEDNSAVILLNMNPLDRDADADYVDQIRAAIIRAYTPQQSGDARPKFENHPFVYWKLASGATSAPGVAEYVALVLQGKDASPLELLQITASYIESMWKVALLDNQFGGLVVDLPDECPLVRDGDQDEDAFDLAVEQWLCNNSSMYLWLSFRHTPADFQSLGFMCAEFDALVKLYAAAVVSKESSSFDASWIDSESGLQPQVVLEWSRVLAALVSELPKKLCLVGSAKVEHLMQVTAPTMSSEARSSEAFDRMRDASAGTLQRRSDNDLFASSINDSETSYPYEMCWKLTLKTSDVVCLNACTLVRSEYTYTTNIVEIFARYGIDAATRLITLEASRVLASDGNVYVQQRHIMLAAHVMTNEGVIHGMNQAGLSKRNNASFIAKSSFEQVTDTITTTANQLAYDSHSHIVGNSFVGQRSSFVGTGASRVFSPESIALHEKRAREGHVPVQDFNSVHVNLSVDAYRRSVEHTEQNTQ